MKSEPIITSAALYLGPQDGKVASLPWLERARAFFAEFSLSPIFFTAYGGDFLYDDCYVLAERGKDLNRFGELIPARGIELASAVRDGIIKSLTLDSTRVGAENRKEWNATVSVDPGEFYVGIDQKFVGAPSHLLHRAFSMASGLLNVRYCVAYKSLLADYPRGYAGGDERSTFADVRFMIRNRREWEKRPKTPEKLWSEELRGKKRHLDGLFRGAYPASILSGAHVYNLNRLGNLVGKLSKLDSDHWLWELSESEIPSAEEQLAAGGLLVRTQAD
jgi:hypothetical protein